LFWKNSDREDRGLDRISKLISKAETKFELLDVEWNMYEVWRTRVEEVERGLEGSRINWGGSLPVT
jgi:hypothetical protein